MSAFSHLPQGSMATYSSNNYSATCDRFGGVLLAHLNSGWWLYLQPGEDANAFLSELEAAGGDADAEAFDRLIGEYAP